VSASQAQPMRTQEWLKLDLCGREVKLYKDKRSSMTLKDDDGQVGRANKFRSIENERG
jgi:hypothetical protein